MISNEDRVLQRPIVIVGAPRSGTTMLGELLGAHPDLAHLQEPRLTWKYGNDRRCDMLRPEDARPNVRRHIRQAFAAAVLESGRPRLVEKTPSNSLRMGFVENVLPGCLFIHIVREGIESTLSIRRFWEQHAHGVIPGKLLQRLREMSPRQIPFYAREFLRRAMPKPLRGLARPAVWGPRVPGVEGLLGDLKLLEVCALQWRMCVEAARSYGSQLPSDRYLEIRLEELSSENLRSILRFCDLDDSPVVHRAFEQRFDARQTRHNESEASAEDVEQVRRWIEPTQYWVGQSRAWTGDLQKCDPSTRQVESQTADRNRSRPAFRELAAHAGPAGFETAAF